VKRPRGCSAANGIASIAKRKEALTVLRKMLATAFLYVASGLSVIPIRPNGSKSPAIHSWKDYQSRRPTEAELRGWFDNDAGYGIAIIGGDVSGYLVILDFDHNAASVFPLWCEVVESLCEGLLMRLVIVQTPGGGYHVYYFCPQVMSSQKLAQKQIEAPEGTDGARLIDSKWMKRVTVIEIKSRGGYVLAPGCPPQCHPKKKAYEIISGNLTDIQTVSPYEHTIMLDAARSFNECIKITSDYWTRSTNRPTNGTRPGDDFNNKADWFELLARHGWKYVHSWNGVTYWKRPGKSEPGISATTNYNGSNLLYCFSTNASPFEDRRGYSLFSAYTLLEHDSDFKAAAKALTEQGYGQKRQSNRIIISPVLAPALKPQNTIKLEPPKRPQNTIQLSKPTRPTVTRILTAEVSQ
jgi:hypothetical protein